MSNLRWAILGTLAFAVVFGSLSVPMHPKPVPPPPTPLEAPVPLLDSTPTADAGAIAMRMVPNTLPSPGPNQIKDPKKCEWPGQFIEGGCWMAVSDVKPPCNAPDGGRALLWPHAGKCWTPFAEAKPIPRSGDPRPLGVADP